MNWIDDETTAYWAAQATPVLPPEPAAQFAGDNFDGARWLARINDAQIPEYALDNDGSVKSSPENIIAAFQNENWLLGCLLVGSWGRMLKRRSLTKIYAPGLGAISEHIANAAQEIIENDSPEQAWHRLTQQLNWSDVMTSKLLHFLARALHEVNAPPVPIDNAAILQWLWPAFVSRCKEMRLNLNDHHPTPRRWRDEYGWDAYNRYMTAVRTWAGARGWSTSELEFSLFQSYKNGEEIQFNGQQF